MRRIITASIVFASATGLYGCSDSNPSAPAVERETQLPHGMMISNSLHSSSASVGANAGAQATLSIDGTAYVSAAPGTFPGATEGRVHNQTTAGAAREFKLSNGGFDPVAISASAGDELIITLSPNGIAPNVIAKVPPRRPPEVVRTEPAKGRTDVALTIQIEVVFSEPVDEKTVTTTSLALFDIQGAVPGKVTVAPNGLSAVFVPDAVLKEKTTYHFVVGQGLKDLDGDSPAETSTVTFTTGETSNVPVSSGELLFVRSDRQIYSINLDGTALTRLTNGGFNNYPRWSPDGRRIAFERNTPGPENRGFGQTDIYLMAADGSNVVRRTQGYEFWSAAWSPDGRKLAVSDEGIYYGNIWMISADDDGEGVRHIASAARTPAWSPDGSKIAFVRTSGDDGYHQAFIMDPDGTHVGPLTQFDSGALFGLAWSPDGSKISFAKCLSGRCDLYVINPDGSEQHELTNVGNIDGAVWSPDGTWLAVVSSAGSSFNQVSTISSLPAKGGVLKTLVVDGYSPSLKPTGK